MNELAAYGGELVSVTIVAIFMAISPGADFAMITRNSIFHSRRAGVLSAIGVAMAIWIHVAYSIAGLAVVISNSIVLFSILKYLGAAYLIYIGWKTFRSSPEDQVEDDSPMTAMTDFEAFRNGFVTNALNPKTTVFFMSIFTQVVAPGTPVAMQLVYGAVISVAHLMWFGFVAVMLTQPVFLGRFNRYRRGIERAVGSVLMAFGVKVAATSSS